MADDSTTPPNGLPVGSDDIGSKQYQRIKLITGIDGVNDGDVAKTNPFPVFMPDATVTGTLTATDAVGGVPAGTGAFINAASTAGSILAIQCPGGDTAWNVQVTGMSAGAIYFEGSLDSTNGTNGNWIAVNGRQTGVVNTVLANNATTNGMYRGNTSGIAWFRVRQTGTYAATPSIVIRVSDGVGAIFLNASIPAGSNNIGSTNTYGGSVASSTQALTAAIASATGTANTTALCVAAVGAAGNATITLKGTFSGTYFFEASDDSGTTWYLVSAARADTSIASTTTGSTTATQMWNVACPGITHLRVRCGTFVSGSCTVLIAPGGFLYAPVVATQQSPRVLFSMATAIAGVTAVTTEALLTMIAQRDGTAVATATSQAVTANKRLRITSMTVGIISTAAAVLSARVSLRMGAAGAATASSPIICTVPIASGAALAQAGGSMTVNFPDGLEFSGAQQLGVSQVASAATGTIWVSLSGYEV